MTGNSGSRTVRVLVSKHEWMLVMNVLHRCSGSEERLPDGHYLLQCAGEDRTWSAGWGDRYRVSIRTSGPTPVGLRHGETLTASINARFFPWDGPHEVTLQLELDGEHPTQTMIGSGFNVTLPQPPQHPDGWNLSPRSLAGVDVTVDRIALEHATMHAMEPPQGDTNSGEVASWIYLSDGGLKLDTRWANYPTTQVSIPVTTAMPDTEPVLVYPRQVGFLTAQSTDETVTIRLPIEPGKGIAILTSEIDALIPPIDRFHANRQHLKKILSEVLELDDIEPDANGNFPIVTREDQQFWVRLATDLQPLTVQVFGIVGERVPLTQEVLVEMNEINSAANYARAVWVNDTVHVVVDLLERDLDRSELDNAMRTISMTVDRYSPFFTPFFTGSDGPPKLPGFE